MISLLLDTSIKNITISIFKDEKQIYFFHEKIFEDLSVKILPLIDEALKKCSIDIKNIDRIYVVTGPGSFTGIRIGLTIIKVLAWSLNKEIIPISSLELMATTDCEAELVVPYIDARRGNCFIGIYDKDLNVIKKDSFSTIEDFLTDVSKNKSYKFVTYDDCNFENKIIPKINVAKIIHKHKFDIPVNPHSVNPNYLKDTEAEENLKKINDKKN